MADVRMDIPEARATVSPVRFASDFWWLASEFLTSDFCVVLTSDLDL